MRKELSSVKLSNEIDVTEEFGLEKHSSIRVGGLFGSLLFVEKLLEAHFALIEKELSEE